MDHTILEAILRISDVLEGILDVYPGQFAAALEKLGTSVLTLEELIFIGSGTSDTSARTSSPVVSFFSGLRTTVLWPAQLERMLSQITRPENTNGLNRRGLYIFTSQTGTSKLTSAMMHQVDAAGCLTLSITESEDTPLAKTSAAHVVMGCGQEAFLMRTIGYAASCLVHTLLALRIGVLRGNISPKEEQQYLQQARAAAENRRDTAKRIQAWLPEVMPALTAAKEVIFTGQGALYGVALEGAVKFWEMPQKPCLGVELEEGMHGPNYGYGADQLLIYLCDGSETDPEKGLSLVRYMKDVYQRGIAVGAVPEALGLRLPLTEGCFSFIEMSAFVQLAAYYLTEAIGRDVAKPIDHSVMNAYFTTHADTPR